MSLQSLGIKNDQQKLFEQYQVVNKGLWKLFEESKTTKDHLKVERFRQMFKANGIDIDPELASTRYLETLPETVVLIDHAVEICQWLARRGEIGIITNGIHSVQTKRIQNSQLAPYISFVSVSEECGYAKPDVRFFEYSVKSARRFSKEKTIIIGDRLEADILGAQNFGIDACWFNPNQIDSSLNLSPTYTIKHLSEIREIS